jgi:lysophospholipid acyltransferase (LPLAT)-like uncharacterized protein
MLKKLLRHPAVIATLSLLLALYGRLVFATSRVHIVTPLPAELKSPVLFALWHQHICAVPLLQRQNPHPFVGLMSASRDGMLTRSLSARFGIGAVVGSSSRGAVPAVRNLIRATRSTAHPSLFLTVDGPRGPAFAAKAGAVEISRLARLPLIPAAMWCAHGHTFASWDHFRFPYPFTTFTLAFGAPMPHTTPEQLTQTLNTLTAQAKAAAAALQAK